MGVKCDVVLNIRKEEPNAQRIFTQLLSQTRPSRLPVHPANVILVIKCELHEIDMIEEGTNGRLTKLTSHRNVENPA